MIDAILPMTGRDIGQFAILRDSLSKFRGDLQRCVAVVPDTDVERFTQLIGDDTFYSLRPESAVLGRRSPRYVFNKKRRRPGHAGRWIQQIVKLQYAASSSAEWCLTLDADVIATRPITRDAMFQGDKGICQIEDEHTHDGWYVGTERVLGLKRSGRTHGVTPALLNGEACRLLIQYLASRALPIIDADWIRMLLNRPPWSEYSLYNTYLEASGRFDKYHVAVQAPVLYDPYEAVWYAGQFDNWTPAKGPDRAIFTLVQSTAKIDPNRIRQKVSAMIGI